MQPYLCCLWNINACKDQSNSYFLFLSPCCAVLSQITKVCSSKTKVPKSILCRFLLPIAIANVRDYHTIASMQPIEFRTATTPRKWYVRMDTNLCNQMKNASWDRHSLLVICFLAWNCFVFSCSCQRPASSLCGWRRDDADVVATCVLVESSTRRQEATLGRRAAGVPRPN